MHRLARISVTSALLAALGCATTGPEPSEPAAPSTRTPPAANVARAPASAAVADKAPAATAAAKAPTPALSFLHDDFAGALARAGSEDKLLFVDAWAEWCHTCKSMQSFVFTEPALTPLEARVVFLALDTEKPENASFLDEYEVNVWPSFFAIDPASKRLVGYWPGSASLQELRQFLDDSVDAREALQGTLDPKSERALLIRAKASQASGKPAEAATLFEQALARAPSDWPRRSEALHGRLWALAQSRQTQKCVRFGERHLSEMQGTSLPAFYASILLECAEHEPKPARRAEVRRAVIERLSAMLAEPPAAMAADDQAEMWSILAGALAAEGRRDEARQALSKRLDVMEQAAARAGTPQAAATFDAGRAAAYVSLGRGEEAVRLLEARMRELPDSYEPPARLASTLEALGRTQAALDALDLALGRAYGPRRLQYLAQRARLLGRLGRHAEQVETLEAEVKGYAELRGGQANAKRLRDAELRLAQARRTRGT